MLADDSESEHLLDNIRSQQTLELGESVKNNSPEIQADDLFSSIPVQDSDEDAFVGHSSSSKHELLDRGRFAMEILIFSHPIASGLLS
jgi:hypothetical protein